jgi:hypothetical protein
MTTSPTHCCRMCSATSYRRVLARDEGGAMRATELYHCSGCSVVFADPRAWREGGGDAAPNAPVFRPLTPLPPAADRRSVGVPDFATYGVAAGSGSTTS